MTKQEYNDLESHILTNDNKKYIIDVLESVKKKCWHDGELMYDINKCIDIISLITLEKERNEK